MRKILGISLIIVPFVVLSVILMSQIGVMQFLVVLGMVLAICLCIFSGFYLLEEENEEEK